MARLMCTVILCVLSICGASARTVSRSIKLQLTPDQQKIILDVHNELRRKEGASNMNKLKWNQELAEMAQEYAETCTGLQGNPSRENPPFLPLGLGQNIWMAGYAVPDNTRQVVEAWYSEKPNYTYANDSCKPGEKCHHYKQVVWADTTDIGCGYADCKSEIGWNVVYCNYGPKGNIPFQPVYYKGRACDSCGTSFPFCDEGLCVVRCSRTSTSCSPAGHDVPTTKPTVPTTAPTTAPTTQQPTTAPTTQQPTTAATTESDDEC